MTMRNSLLWQGAFPGPAQVNFSVLSAVDKNQLKVFGNI